MQEGLCTINLKFSHSQIPSAEKEILEPSPLVTAEEVQSHPIDESIHEEEKCVHVSLS